MSTPDNRISFPSTLVDFSQVGTTGQDHDLYPAAGHQARFDHLRLYLIGLLANQSSYNAPNQYRDGTIWFDLNDLTVKIRSADQWKPLSDTINAGASNLTDWIAGVNLSLESVFPELTYSGVISGSTGIDYITIPQPLSAYITNKTRAFIIINGENPLTTSTAHKMVIVDPRHVTIEGTPAALLRLQTLTLESGDTFTVSLRRIPDEAFITPTITVF